MALVTIIGVRPPPVAGVARTRRGGNCHRDDRPWRNDRRLPIVMPTRPPSRSRPRDFRGLPPDYRWLVASGPLPQICRGGRSRRCPGCVIRCRVAALPCLSLSAAGKARSCNSGLLDDVSSVGLGSGPDLENGHPGTHRRPCPVRGEHWAVEAKTGSEARAIPERETLSSG